MAAAGGSNPPIVVVNITGYQAGTIAAPGAVVSEADEDNADSLQISLNIDFDKMLQDEDGGSLPDYFDYKAGAADDDLIRIDLKATPSSVASGVVEFIVPDGFRVFDASGNILQNEQFQVDLSDRSGPLANIRNGVTLFLEATQFQSTTGEFVLRYVNGSVTSEDTLKYVLVDPNIAPIVDAGEPRWIEFVDGGVALQLSGEVSDPDAMPFPLTSYWEQFGNSPATASIDDIHSLSPTVTFPQRGSYTFILTAFDGLAIRSDTVTVTVASKVSVNLGDSSNPDIDADGLPDSWELLYFGTIRENDFDDFDGDKVSNLDEFLQGTDPTVNEDTDGDGLPDHWEIFYWGNLDQTGDADPDGDGISNVREFAHGTNPTVAETYLALSFDLPEGTYVRAKLININNPNSFGEVRYTINGVDPTAGSTLFVQGNPIQAPTNGQIKIRAQLFIDGVGVGSVLEGTYAFRPYADASRTIYFGVLENGQFAKFGYSFSPGYVTFELGQGWLINGVYVPDLSVESRRLYYGSKRVSLKLPGKAEHGYTYLRMYSVNATTFDWSIPQSNGWITSSDSTIPDYNKSSRPLYYVKKQFSEIDSSDTERAYGYLTLYSVSNEGQFALTVPHGDGWTLGPQLMIPDYKKPSRVLYYGRKRFPRTGIDGKEISHNYISIYSISNSGLEFSIQQSDGWIKGPQSIEPDYGKSSCPLYYGKKRISEKNAAGKETTYFYLDLYTLNHASLDFSVQQSDGWTTGPESMVPDYDKPSRPLYYASKRFSVKNADKEEASYSYPVFHTVNNELTLAISVSQSEGWTTGVQTMVPDYEKPSRPLYYIRKRFPRKNAANEEVSYSYWEVLSLSAGNADMAIPQSDGWIKGPMMSVADYTKPSRQLHYGLKGIANRDSKDAVVTSTSRFLYSLNAGSLDSHVTLSDGWLESGYKAVLDFTSPSRNFSYGNVKFQFTDLLTRKTEYRTIWMYAPTASVQQGYGWASATSFVSDFSREAGQIYWGYRSGEGYFHTTNKTGMTNVISKGLGWIVNGSFVAYDERYGVDEDGDGILGGVEVEIYGTNPLMVDTDSDGLNDYEEIFVYRTNPLMPDTDGDYYLDGYEVANAAYGFDPLVYNEPKILVDTDGDGLLDSEELIYGTNIFVVDTDGDGFSDKVEIDAGSNPLLASSRPMFGDYGDIVIPPPSTAANPKYRKIGLNGFPLSDKKPQNTEETDEENEETYIDAFSVSLSHSTTDVYVPIAGTELNLTVRRNFSGDIWSNRNGFRPQERVDRPFGAGWTSSLCPHLKLEINFTPNGTVTGRYVTVVDENGSSFRFMEQGNQYVPFPSSELDSQTYLATLTGNEYGYVFRKKHGTTLRFGATFKEVNGLGNRDAGDLYDASYVRYHRLRAVEDRYGNKLEYLYAGQHSLVPSEIRYVGTEGLSQSIQIEMDGDLVTSVTDPRGNTTRYYYTQETVSSLNVIPYAFPLMTRVESPELSAGVHVNKHYQYDFAVEEDYKSKYLWSYGVPNKMYHVNIRSVTDPNGHIYQFGYQFNHSNRYSSPSGTIAYIQNGAPRFISEVILPDGLGTSYFGQIGLFKYTVAANAYWNWGTAHLDNRFSGYASSWVRDTEGNVHVYDFTDYEVRQLPNPFAEDYLTDIPRMLYFQNLKISHYEGGGVILTAPSTPAGSGTVEHEAIGSTLLMGSESYRFALSANLEVVQSIDFSGNITEFEYGDTFLANPPSFMRSYFNNFMETYADVTRQTNALGGEQLFTYDPEWRVMTSFTDEASHYNKHTLDNLGRRTSESKYDRMGGTLLQQTLFAYENQDFPLFMTRKVVKKLQGDPAWAKDLTTQYVPDGLGRIAMEIVDPGGLNLVTEHTYDANNNKISTTDPIGNTTYFEYDALNRLIGVAYPPATGPGDPSAARKTITYDLRGNKIKETDENGNTTLYVYDALNRLVETARDMDGNGSIDGSDLRTSNHYNRLNSITRTVDPNGNITRMSYDALQRLVETRLRATENASIASDIITTFVYDKSRNAGGSAFDTSAFKPTSARDAMGYVTEVIYDALYRPVLTFKQIQLSPPLYSVTQTYYDAVGNERATVRYVNPVGSTSGFSGAVLDNHYAFHPVANDGFYVADDVRIEVKEYDALKRPVRVINPDGTSVQTSYTSAGFQYRSTDELGRLTEMHYDAAGRQAVMIQPEADDGSGVLRRAVTLTQYDANGNVRFVTNPRGVSLGQGGTLTVDETYTWEYLYDARNRKTHEIQPAVSYYDDSIGWVPVAENPVVVTAYDPVGNVVAQSDARGNTTYTRYDAANRPVAVVYPEVSIVGGSSVYPVAMSEFDDNGNIRFTKQGKIASGADPLTASPVVVRTEVINVWDALNRLVSSTDAEDITVTNEYDAAGNRIAVIDGRQQRTEFEYDGLKRNTVTRHPDFSEKTFVFNALHQTQRIDESGSVTSYSYDRRDRLKRVDYGNDGIVDREYSYDAVGSILAVTEGGVGQDVRNVAYAYDGLNRIVIENSGAAHAANIASAGTSLPSGVTGGVSHHYRYDLAGNRLAAEYGAPGGAVQRTLTSTYDALNRTETMSEGARVSAYRYDLTGNICETWQGNGDVVTKTYDTLNRVVGIVGPDGSDASPLYESMYSYDVFGNLTVLAEAYPSIDSRITPRLVTLVYDGANRLLSETAEQGTDTVETVYSYDKAHNRESKLVLENTVVTLHETYISNPLNQITEFTDTAQAPARTVSFTYDENGNRVTRSEGLAFTRYSYDSENRLLSVAVDEDGDIINDRVYEYTYDYRTRRVLRDESTAGGEKTHIIFSGGTSVQEYAYGGSAPTVEYIRGSDYGGGIGGLLYSLRGGVPSFKHYNSRGDVVAATDEDRSLTYQAAYEAFGRHGDTSSSEEWGVNPDRQQANTKDEDPTGLLNEGFRYRDLETGAFITRDPLGFVDGPNLYTYVVQNPWTKFDPMGLARGDIHAVGQIKHEDPVRVVMYVSLVLLELHGNSKNANTPDGVEFSMRIVYDDKSKKWSHGNALEGDSRSVSPNAPVPPNNEGEAWSDRGWAHNHPGFSGDQSAPVEMRDPFSVGGSGRGGGDKFATLPGSSAWVVEPNGAVYRFDKPEQNYDKLPSEQEVDGTVSYVGNANEYLEGLKNENQASKDDKQESKNGKQESKNRNRDSKK